jgi:hypothetical protein
LANVYSLRNPRKRIQEMVRKSFFYSKKIPYISYMIYNQIYEFCKVRNHGSVFSNTENPTPRVEFLIKLLDKEGIPYVIDKYKYSLDEKSEIWCYNIILRGDSDKMLVAHHDIVNPDIDNANDNSASVINAIALKKMLPNVHVVLLDGEEFGGIGSQRLSRQINRGEFGEISFVLNLELSGKVGKKFFVGDYPGPLYEKIKSQFNCPTVKTPFNDSVIFRRNGIDSCVINPLPTTDQISDSPLFEEALFEGKKLDMSMLFHCHSTKDTIDTIDPNDMKEFTEEVVFKILE